ncbi:hypothetical protein WMY93_018873 [Mugilogobius chulae]|uniref:Bcl-x interacting BH3 domain-containing protein n=1 Tax=Mugilogobius chulae TaxID=88201 RepID=A0AAW0NPC9_9GOBI
MFDFAGDAGRRTYAWCKVATEERKETTAHKEQSLDGALVYREPTRPCGTPLDRTSETRTGDSANSPSNLRALDPHGNRGTPSSSAAQTDTQGGSQSRSSRAPRRESSGYFSSESDSVPASPLLQQPQMIDEATQTVSPSAQVIEHALSSLAGHRQSESQRLNDPRGSNTVDSMRDQQAVLVGRELREHGDEFNRILTQRAQAGRAHPHWWPVDPREPAVIVCVGFLIYIFGQLLYSHGTTYRQSQV